MKKYILFSLLLLISSVAPASEEPTEAEEDHSTWNEVGSDIKSTSGKAWDATKEGSSKAWDATKEGSSNAWDATKKFSSETWEKTKNTVSDDDTSEGVKQ